MTGGMYAPDVSAARKVVNRQAAKRIENQNVDDGSAAHRSRKNSPEGYGYATGRVPGTR